jgi:hypothetical protein
MQAGTRPLKSPMRLMETNVSLKVRVGMIQPCKLAPSHPSMSCSSPTGRPWSYMRPIDCVANTTT